MTIAREAGRAPFASPWCARTAKEIAAEFMAGRITSRVPVSAPSVDVET